jgi:hypothetical protein
MATGVLPSGTFLAVHLQKCSHTSNEIRVMRKIFNIYDIFSYLHGKGLAKPKFAISLELKKKNKKNKTMPAGP